MFGEESSIYHHGLKVSTEGESPMSQDTPNTLQPPFQSSSQTLPTPQPQPPSKRIRQQDKTAKWFIASLLLVSAIIVISILATCGAPANNASSNVQATATDSARQTAVVVQLTDIAATQTAEASTSVDQPTSQPTNQPTPTPTQTFATFTDGTFQVGSDIQPGTYRTQTGSPGCYYARLSGFTGTIDDILANNNTDNPAIVTILPSDKGFESKRCGTWTKL
jgi:type II secretory pathway pseudopilin PulG